MLPLVLDTHDSMGRQHGGCQLPLRGSSFFSRYESFSQVMQSVHVQAVRRAAVLAGGAACTEKKKRNRKHRSRRTQLAAAVSSLSICIIHITFICMYISASISQPRHAAMVSDWRQSAGSVTDQGVKTAESGDGYCSTDKPRNLMSLLPANSVESCSVFLDDTKDPGLAQFSGHC
ncbi:hypothetical protein BaRGS_00024179 [Batillaria attramentaria]|uniref:Uncharacterized protein n=1 Tax=Batillaria attramentaria TaxID=370345 RepID=A0ABD0KBX7_9CAEN